MRIVAWNINHRAREKTIPDHLAAAIASLDPDVIVLTEYVDGSTAPHFMRASLSTAFATCSCPGPGEEKTRS